METRAGTDPRPVPRGETGARPRLGFVGLGWIGRARLEALCGADVADVVALADTADECRTAAERVAPGARAHRELDALLAEELDGLVIATPSALHAEQARRALDAGVAVFCQKPLARDAFETAAVIEAARHADRLLAVDLSYRHLDGVALARERIASGALGRLRAGRFTFHNAYGPDKPWFRDPALSGGGCVIDLGVHLVDLAVALFGAPVRELSARLLAQGVPLEPAQRGSAGAVSAAVEDYAVARLDLESGAVVELACSWWLQAGRDAVIELVVYGERGGLAIRNVGGSFFDFETVALEGTRERRLHVEDGAWGGRALLDWTHRLAAGEGFDPGAEDLLHVASVLDAIYGRS